VRPYHIIAATCLALVGCSSGESTPVQRETLRLADRVAAALGRSTQLEQVAGVTRAALPGAYTEVLQHAGMNPRPVDIREDADGAIASFRCPARLVGRPAILLVGLPAKVLGVPGKAQADPELVTRPIHCPEAADTQVQVRLPRGPELEKALWLMRGLELDRVETPTMALHHDARLQVALGLAPIGTSPAPGRFRVVAQDGRGRTATVLERRLDAATNPEDGSWVRMDVDLEPVRRAIGPDVRFRFEAGTDGDGAMPALPVWGDPTLVWPHAERAQAPRRNVVLVSLDTLRADRLGVYGGPRPTSPTLDALAAESTLFETVVAPAPWTLPSHASMMTGLYACAHGVIGPGIGGRLPNAVSPLAERLRVAGYATAAFTEDGFVDSSAFARGFGYYWENREGDDRIPRTVAQAQAWLQEEAAEPFFLFFHTYQTHDPYYAPPPYATMFESAGGGHPVPVAHTSADEQALAKYDAAVRYTDAAIVPLLDAIRRSPLGERTLLVVTSDHGEAFHEHGYTGHGRTLHEEVLRVPLLVWSPGLVARGRRVAGLVGLIDTAPTILDLLGLPLPSGIAGISLAAQVRADRSPGALPERPLFSENTLHDIYRLVIRWPRWKAMWDGADLKLFDLERDPSENVVDPIGSQKDRATAVRAEFEAQCARQRAELAAAGAPRPETPPALPDPGRERQLRALGYIE
jgi:arylsulfatase A-like enzyme